MNSLTLYKPALSSSLLPTSWFSWSARGFAITLFCGYLALDPVLNSYDIVAAVVAATFGLLLLLAACLVLLHGLILRRSFTIGTGIPESLPVFSQHVTSLAFQLHGLRLAPFLKLEIAFHFNAPDLAPISATISAAGSVAAMPLIVPVEFPHRGNWRLTKASWVLFDVFDLWSFSHTQTYDDTHTIIPVSPPPGFEGPPPIINSCLRDGDAISDIQEPRGDYYDLKAYHPSDGMRKIVWKIFARSGELLSRHQEKTMTPEGRVLMIVCARSVHDNAARLAINYCSYILDAGLECKAVVLGQKHHRCATTATALESLLIETAWESDSSSTEGLLEMLLANSQAGHDALVSHIVVLGDFTRPSSGYCDLLHTLGAAITKQSLVPVFLVAVPAPHEIPTQSSQPNVLTRLFLQQDSRAEIPLEYDSFISAATDNSWEVYKLYE